MRNFIIFIFTAFLLYSCNTLENRTETNNKDSTLIITQNHLQKDGSLSREYFEEWVKIYNSAFLIPDFTDTIVYLKEGNGMNHKIRFLTSLFYIVNLGESPDHPNYFIYRIYRKDEYELVKIRKDTTLLN